MYAQEYDLQNVETYLYTNRPIKTSDGTKLRVIGVGMCVVAIMKLKGGTKTTFVHVEMTTRPFYSFLSV